jgi:hypothetical protein
MKFLVTCVLYLCLIPYFAAGQIHKIVESNSDRIKIEFNFENRYIIRDTLIEGIKFQYVIGDEYCFGNPGEPYIPNVILNIGIPFNSKPQVKIVGGEQEKISQIFLLPYPDSLGQPLSQLNFQDTVYSINEYFPQSPIIIKSTSQIRYANIASISVSPFQFNPSSRELLLNKKLNVIIEFHSGLKKIPTLEKVDDQMTSDILKSIVINPNEARSFMGKMVDFSEQSISAEKSWYDPQKNYYKLFLNKQGVYRVTYDNLLALGIPEFDIQQGKFEIINDGLQIPIDITDKNSDNLFNSGDYFQFIGKPPKGSTEFTYFNIYNLQNVYWLSYQADSTARKYKIKDGFPNSWNSTFLESPHTIHYEKDSLYERLGHAPNDKRDFWYWGKTSGENGKLSSIFDPEFPALPNLSSDSTNITLRVNMHGMTTSGCINPDHRVKIYLTGQLVGEHTFDGPNSSTFEKTFSSKDIAIFGTNYLQVAAFGDINPCRPGESTSDEIRVNWFEIEYSRYHRAENNNFSFISPPYSSGKTRFNVFNWKRDNMKIYIPSKEELIQNPQFLNDEFNITLFVDSVYEKTEYYCVADDYFFTPDSIVRDIPSNLRSFSNAADYIIITHEKFTSVANKLADLRSINFPDTTIKNPRIYIADVHEIYDEFSGGLLDPYAIKSFVKYAFENWEKPSAKYVVLIGDMSFDYRKLIKDSRPNFIPSIPYKAFLYGQAASDNMFVAVAGNDILPDLAIGRLSCETVEEGNILIDKLENYPSDNSKEWKQNVLLIASGQDAADEQLFGFNSASFLLDDLFVKPSGISSAKVFRYPREARDFQFVGEGPKIREEFNRGAVLANYYGHGGGYQWDLVFLNDDIYQLQNQNRLPFISSVTCYTAHFDNQDVFGEQFNKVPGKGSISFWGSSGLTWWSIGQSINNSAFSRIFNNKEYVSGDFILRSKYQLGSGDPYRDSQVALLTLLGDPVLKLALPDKPDFQIKSADISIEPTSPKKNELVVVKVKIRNLGVIFPGQSVKIELFAKSNDFQNAIDTLTLQNFGEIDSVLFSWIPPDAGLFTITARVNLIDPISEMDYLDNEANASFAVYDLSKPNIVSPIDGRNFSNDQQNFLFIDNGYYLGLSVQYFIEIDTLPDFTNPVIKSSGITPENGLVKWNVNGLKEGKYFWRARIYNAEDSSQWSDTRTFSVSAQPTNHYSYSEKQLKLFSLNGIQYKDSLNGLVLITNELPPHPSVDSYLESISVNTNAANNLSSITTDGKYIYYASMAFYNNLQPSRIYRIGTGYQGTIQGEPYGHIPNVEVPIWHTMFYYSDGYIYVSIGDAYSLLRVDIASGDTSMVSIPSGLINESGFVKNGSFYLNTDGKYVYNLAYTDSLQRKKYTVRVFDPTNNWEKIAEDLILDGLSFDYYTNFFAAKEYIYTYESGLSGYLRRFNANNGQYEEEWLSFSPYKGFYSWCYDWLNDKVYASVFRSGFTPSIYKFSGTYRRDFGSLTSLELGPAKNWKEVSYEVETNGSNASYKAFLLGFNKNKNAWENLNSSLPSVYSLTNLNSSVYNKLKVSFEFRDSTYGSAIPLILKSLNVTYTPLPEIILTKNNFIIQPDSVLQGFPISTTLNVRNVGFSSADSVSVSFYLDNSDLALYTKDISISTDTMTQLSFVHQTENLIPQSFYKIKAIASLKSGEEYYVYNNILDKDFFVVRDSVSPQFSITFDGKEIVNGDVVSAKPEVLISLKDDSPLPLDTTLFTIIFDNLPLSFVRQDVTFNYTPYPNSEALIKWTPVLADGRHTIEVLAKDASGNFFDTTVSRTEFYVFNQPNLLNVFNFPNPFNNDTYFTFDLRGTVVPDEFIIKIYTVAGRLIRVISVPSSDIFIGFNKIYWDGRDEDGDELSNGVYFYKVITRLNDETKIITSKLAKIK